MEAAGENGTAAGTSGRESNRAVKSAGRNIDRTVDKQRTNSAREPPKNRDGGSDASTSSKVERRLKCGGQAPSSTNSGYVTNGVLRCRALKLKLFVLPQHQ